MQTFLPYPDFTLSARCLDRRRLGKQRVEVLQLLRALRAQTTGWRNHPATKMWRGHEWNLGLYGIACCDEWIARGYRDTCREKIRELALGDGISDPPPWLGNLAFHSAHRAALLEKNFAHYSQFGWSESPRINYIWPEGAQP